MKVLVEKARAENARLQKDFDQESKKEENNKLHGQPLHDAIDSILRDEFGCNRGVAHGGDFQGEAIRTIMGRRVELFQRFRQTLLAQPEKRFLDERIVEMCDLYERVFGHLDAIFSIARTKRFKLTLDDIEKCKKHHFVGGGLCCFVHVPSRILLGFGTAGVK